MRKSKTRGRNGGNSGDRTGRDGTARAGTGTGIDPETAPAADVAEGFLHDEPAPGILERSFDLAVAVTRFGVELDRRRGVGSVLVPQVVRAATSVGSRVEEAQAAESKADFVSKMSIALKEAHETHFRLRVILAAGLSATDLTSPVLDAALNVKRILGAIVVNSRRNAGTLRNPAP